ncbi:MAG: hypothetical protein QXU79_00080 [Candidatus Micrarchaeaceae archaeon]
MAFLRDMLIRLRLQDAGAIPALERANQLTQDLQDAAREVGPAFAQAASQAASSFAAAEGPISTLGDALRGIYADFKGVQATLGGIGLAGLGLLHVAANAAMEAEWAMRRAEVLTGQAFSRIVAAVEQESRRFRNALNVSDVIEAMFPVFMVLGERSDIVVQALGRISEAVIMAGGDMEAMRRVWMYVSQAIATGSPEILFRARALGFPLIRGEEAEAIARRMRREYDAVTNAMILMQAIAKSTGIEQSKLNQIMDTANFTLIRLRSTWTEFKEQFGKGFMEARRGIWDTIVDKVLGPILGRGGAEPMGRWFSIFSTILAGLGGAKLISAILAKLGIATGGTILGMLGAVLPWVVGIGALALVIQDLLSADSVIKRIPVIFDSLLRAAGEFTLSLLTGRRKLDESVAKAMTTGPMEPYAEAVRKAGKSPEAIVQKAPTGEVAWERLRDEAAKALVQELWMAGAKLYPTKEIEALGFPAIAAGIFGPAWEEVLQKWVKNELTVTEAFKQALQTYYFGGGREAGGPGFEILRYYEALGRLDEIAREFGVLPPPKGAVEPALEGLVVPQVPGMPEVRVVAAPGVTQVQVTVEQGAVVVNVPPGGLEALTPAQREEILRQVLDAIAAQLRAVMGEQVAPGVR